MKFSIKYFFRKCDQIRRKLLNENKEHSYWKTSFFVQRFQSIVIFDFRSIPLVHVKVISQSFGLFKFVLCEFLHNYQLGNFRLKHMLRDISQPGHVL